MIYVKNKYETFYIKNKNTTKMSIVQDQDFYFFCQDQGKT